MSKLGNGFIFRVQRTNQIVEIDSADVKFNETFSDCRDRQEKLVKGGRVLDPNLINSPEPEDKEPESRLSGTNYYSNISDDEQDETEANSNSSETSEVEIEITN